MARKRFTAEQIITSLREAEILLAKGKTVAEVCRHLSITENTCCRWRKEYGGLDDSQARHLKQLEPENARLKMLLAEKELDIEILKEAGRLNSRVRRADAKRSSGCAASCASVSAGPAGRSAGCSWSVASLTIFFRITVRSSRPRW
jgi:putative transposase